MATRNVCLAVGLLKNTKLIFTNHQIEKCSHRSRAIGSSCWRAEPTGPWCTCAPPSPDIACSASPPSIDGTCAALEGWSRGRIGAFEYSCASASRRTHWRSGRWCRPCPRGTLRWAARPAWWPAARRRCPSRCCSPREGPPARLPAGRRAATWRASLLYKRKKVLLFEILWLSSEITNPWCRRVV